MLETALVIEKISKALLMIVVCVSGVLVSFNIDTS